MWFEKFNFKRDPYQPLDPFMIPLDLIRWDRDDLAQRDDFFRFLDDVVAGNRVGLRAYGAIGSGKTWLMRYLQKTSHERLDGRVAVIYGKLPRLDPKFSTLYYILVEQWNEYRGKILATIEEKVGRELTAWKHFVKDSDLATCLHEIRYPSKEEQTLICEQWLRGIKIAARELASVGITSSLDSDYLKYLILRKLLNLSLLAFETCILIVDELENASASLARALGDSLRDLLDSFSERFALACSYTAQAADEMLDWGYGEWLFRRLEYEVKLEPVRPNSAPAILRIHHTAYRKEGYQGDQLLPLTEEGLRRLINLMEQEYWYPGHIFVNCRKLAQLAGEQDIDTIDENFVDNQVSENPMLFQYLASSPRLM